MGKALVIEGLSSGESLGKVTFVSTVNVISVSLNKNNISSLKVETEEKLYATIKTDNDGVLVKASWKSDNDEIATVSQEGIVTGKNVGTCTITATCGNKSDSCTVNVVVNIDLLTKDYFDSNRTINEVEKKAYTRLVEGLYADGCWDKIKYLYPMLGSTVEDLIIDAKHKSYNLLKELLDESTLSVEDRILYLSKGNLSYKSLSKTLQDLYLDDISSFMSFEIVGNVNNFNALALINSNVQNRFQVDPVFGGYADINVILSNNNSYKKGVDINSYTKRLIGVSFKKGTGLKIYKDNNSYYEDEAANSTPESNEITRGYAFINNSESKYPIYILAFGESISTEEWGKIYNRLIAFFSDKNNSVNF